jgi:hypothetical protein
MPDFDELMGEHQTQWRKNNLDSDDQGWQNGKQYPWVLPRNKWQDGLWHDIRGQGGDSLQAYLKHNKIQKHSGSHNLKSSWILCANLYFPFGRTQGGRSLLASFLCASIDSTILSVDSVELEWAAAEEDDEIHPSKLLGEAGGNRGAGQTSPDLAFTVNGGTGLILVENKFVEHSFYRCSARRTHDSTERPGNPDTSRCLDASAVRSDPVKLCHQNTWGRRYWDHLAPVIAQKELQSLKCCPAAKAGYQLFRQQALAEGIAASGRYASVTSCVAVDERNTTLQTSLRSTGIPDSRKWGEFFHGKARFAVFSHQQWVDWVAANGDEAVWGEWVDWVRGRYGFSKSDGTCACPPSAASDTV